MNFKLISNFKFQIKNLRRRVLILALGILTVGALGLVIASNLKAPAMAAWWNDAWGYRNAVSVTAHTVAESNVYVSVTVNSSSNFQADCGDMRWTDEGGSVLPYYIVSGCGGASTVTHVLLKSFPAGAQTLYYYYGNPSAANGFSAADFATEAADYTIGTIGSQEKSNGPVAYWDFNEGTGTVASDRTGNGNNGTLTGGPTWQSEDLCVSGKCLKFDGSDDIVSLSTPATIPNGSNARTVSLWVKSLATQGKNVFGYGTSSGDQLFDIIYYGGNVCLHWHGNDCTAIFNNSPYTNNVWQLITVTYDGTTVKMYINGVLRTSVAKTLNTGSSGTLYIGSGAYSSYQYFNGLIDEPKIYNYARSAEQIKADYNNRISEMEGTSAVLGAENSNSLNQGLVGYWKMDESSWNGTAGEVRDASGNGNNGVAVSGATTAGGKFGNGGSFDGTNDNASVTTSTVSPGSGDFTFGSWFKNSASASNWDAIMVKYGSPTAYFWGVWINDSHKLYFQIRDGNNNSIIITGSTNVNDGLWHHVFGVRKGTSAYLYMDGVLVGTGTNESLGPIDTSSSSNPLLIGGWGYTSATDDYFLGSIDETRIYNRALSPAEVQQLYQFAPGPVAYYNFEEGSGSTVNDASTYGNTGTWSGQQPYWTNGKVGKSGKFNGVDNTVSAADSSSLDSVGAVSVSAWVKTSSTNDYSGIFGKYDLSNNGYQMGFDTSGGVRADFGNGSAYLVAKYSSSNVEDGKWHFIVGTYDGTTAKIYVDGVIGGTTASGTGYVTASSQIATIGNDPCCSSRFFNGQIDEVKVYNYARTQAQIMQDMKGTGSLGTNLGGLSRGVGGVVGWWDFDEGTGTVANDRSGRENGGTLTNMSSPATLVSGWNQTGKVNKALSFDGTNDYVTFGGSNMLDMRQGFTACGFVKLNVAGGSQTFLGKGRDSTSTYSYVLEAVYSGGAPRFEIYDGSSNPGVSATTVLGAGTWSHLCGTYDGKNLKIYVNSKLENSTPTTVDPGANSSDFVIGKWPNASNYYLNGQADEVKIYNYALTAEEIRADFNQGKALVLGSFSDTSQVSGGSVASNSASAIYCVPGSSESCAGPVGVWNFEEGSGTSVADTAGTSGAGTFSGTGPNWANGRVGKAGNFNGGNSYVTGPNFDLLSDGSQVTISAWFYLKDGTNWNPIIGYPGGTGSPLAIIANVWGSNTIAVAFNTGTCGWAGTLSLFTPVTINTWHHLAFTHHASAGDALYIDGQLKSSSTTACGNLTFGSAPIYFGLFNNAGTNYFMNGMLDEVRIYNYIRSKSQIAWDYNRGKPVGHWDFDECQGTTLNDSSGNGNVGTLTNASAGTCAESGSTSWYLGRTGKFNASVYFDGSNDYVSVADSNSLDLTSAFTISAWGNLSGTGAEGDSVVLSKGLTASAENYSLYVQDDGDIGLEYYNGGWYSKIFSVPSFSTGTWYHYVLTYDGTNLRAYRNGALLGVQALSSSPVANSGTLQIGGVTAYNNRWQGQLDDVAIYSYALTPVQVKQVYTGGFGVRFGPTSGNP